MDLRWLEEKGVLCDSFCGGQISKGGFIYIFNIYLLLLLAVLYIDYVKIIYYRYTTFVYNS